MKFTVNLNAGIVIARYTEKNNRDYWKDVLYRTLLNVDVDSLLGSWEKDELVTKIVDDISCFCGKAKLNPEDVFDEEIGKRVAVRDLNRRFNKAKTRVLMEFERILKMRYEETMKRSAKRWF